MVILLSNSADRYTTIKRKTCVERNVPTQVIQARTLNNKGLMSVATKVGIQMNAKLGCLPWFTKIPLSQLMVVGYDISRDTANKRKTFGALVASLQHSPNNNFYYSNAQQHEDDRTMSDMVGLMMVGALRAYSSHYDGALPNKILFYRDGVGEGQLEHVYEFELQDIREKINQVYNSYNQRAAATGNSTIEPRLTFIVVSKRVNTRFFVPKYPNHPIPAKFDNDAFSNPKAGTVVDNTVTLPERYDFFLISQNVRQGTVSPTAYNVIYDDIQLPPEKLHLLTYRFCHLYYNWSGTVRVPAVVQYAKKLAFLCSQFLHRNPNPNMGTRLYFL